MNYLLLIAGVLTLFASIGHFTIGAKDFLKPVLSSDIDIIPKKIMHSLFHYMSVFQTLTAILLISFSFDEKLIFENINDVTKLIGITYAGFAIVQFLTALFSGIKGGVLKLFPWVFWALIALFSLLSVQW